MHLPGAWGRNLTGNMSWIAVSGAQLKGTKLLMPQQDYFRARTVEMPDLRDAP
jgi:hypothetical protein